MTHPTDDEIMELAGAWFHTGENQKRDDGYYYRSLGTPSNVRGSDLIEFARALLAEQARTEPTQEFESAQGRALASAWAEGWAQCRDAEYVGDEAESEAFNQSHTLAQCLHADQTRFQGGLSNDQLRRAWSAKLPNVILTDEKLTALALGIEAAAQPSQAPVVQAVQAREYPPMPNNLKDIVDGLIWSLICEWADMTPGDAAGRVADKIDAAILDAMRAYVDADRAAAQVEPSKVDAYERTTQPSLTTGYEAHQKNGLAWAVNCWVQEVKYRPLINVHRRTLDDTWRQVIRYFGGDPDKLIGPSHDALMDAEPKRNGRPISWGEESPTAQVEPVRMLPACEQQYILSNPSAIMELMTYRYLQQDQADSMEAGTHGDHTRYVELARLGQSIIDQDPECFSEELRDEYARALRYIELQDAAGKRIPADGEVR